MNKNEKFRVYVGYASLCVVNAKNKKEAIAHAKSLSLFKEVSRKEAKRGDNTVSVQETL